MLGDVLYRAGEALGSLEGRVRGDAGPAVLDDREVAVDAAISAGAAWLVARLLRPRPVRWSRVVVAGVAGALLSEIVGRLQDDSPDPERLPYAANPAELVGRMAAGVAVAAGYASIVYPRLPGSPLMRGLAFGALEIAAAPRGGLVRLAAEAPGLRFPLQALALPVDEDASPAAHLAFGLALGLLYRTSGGDAGAGDDDELDDDEIDDDFDDEL